MGKDCIPWLVNRKLLWGLPKDFVERNGNPIIVDRRGREGCLNIPIVGSRNNFKLSGYSDLKMFRYYLF